MFLSNQTWSAACGDFHDKSLLLPFLHCRRCLHTHTRARARARTQTFTHSHADSQLSFFPLFMQDVMSLQADLAEAAMLRQRQEEILHQRERELTALKGALKEEVECHDREMEALREQYSQDMENLRQTMEQVTQVEHDLSHSVTKKLDGVEALMSELDLTVSLSGTKFTKF